MSNDAAPLSAFLDHGTVVALREHAGEAEGAKKLHARQMEIIRARKWFKLFVPPQWGGLGLTLPQALRLEEALAWADGSTAWVVTLCAGAGWFVGFVDPVMRDELFAATESCLAGSGAAAGTAEAVDDGYLINGDWPYASGAEHATAFTANCLLTQAGQPVRGPDGGQQTAAFVFSREEVVLRRTWNSIGLAATGSHGFAVHGCVVPARRRFQIEARCATLADTVYRYPFLQLAEATLAVNLSGMAVRFLELAGALVGDENGRSPGGTPLIAERKRLDTVRSALFSSVDASWETLQREGMISESGLSKVTTASQRLAAVSREGVDTIYPLCGLRAAEQGSEINRVWRNFHTATQHALLRAAAVGRSRTG